MIFNGASAIQNAAKSESPVKGMVNNDTASPTPRGGVKNPKTPKIKNMHNSVSSANSSGKFSIKNIL